MNEHILESIKTLRHYSALQGREITAQAATEVIDAYFALRARIAELEGERNAE